MTELDLHRAVARYLDLALPNDAIWTTFPAGGGGKVRGAKLKAMGLKPGWPDIQIIWRGKFYTIELKTKNGKASSAQIKTMKRIYGAGGFTTLAYSIMDVEAALQYWGIPVRASVLA